MNKEIKLLNPSCSELVTFLGITEPEEVRVVLKEICKRYDYKVKLIPSCFDPISYPGIEINIDRLDVNKDINVFTFANLLIDQSNANLEYAFENNLITENFYLEHKNDEQKLSDLVGFLSKTKITLPHFIKLVLMDKDNIFVEISYQMCSGYDETPGLSLQASQHCIANEFPLLGNVYLMNPELFKYVAFDGGSTSDFEEWLGIKKNKRPEDLDNWIKTKKPFEQFIKKFAFKQDEKE